MTLVEFLLARIEEDEKIGRLLQRTSLGEDRQVRLVGECEAKRAIVALHPEAVSDGLRPGAEWAYDEVLRRLSLAYADHPDYDETWRP